MSRNDRPGAPARHSDARADQAPQVVSATVLADRPLPGLHLVATPIGTARDITLRALDVLNGADLLAAEDTRTLRHLMAIHGIPLRGRRILAYHDHNADAQRPPILRALSEGASVAYCSDAGTPLVADPGFRLARDAAESGARVHAVPGPSALLAALTVAPEAAAARQALLEAAGQTAVLALPGYLAGLALGAGIAVMLSLVPVLSGLVTPLAVALRSVPIVATAPLVVLLLGRGAAGTIALVALMVFFPTFVACQHGLRQAPGQILDVLRGYAAGRLAQLVHVRIPAMLPAFFASARMGVPAAILAVTVAEWLATGRGLGNLMTLSASLSDYTMLWLTVALVTLMNERLAVGSLGGVGADDILRAAAEIDTENGPMVRDAGFRQRLADWYVQAQGLRNTRMRTITALSRGQTPGPDASITKLVIANVAQDLASQAMEIEDQYGILMDEGLTPAKAAFQHSVLSSPGMRIAGGTDEILKNIIAERVLGLPPEIRVDKTVPFKDLPTGR